MEEARPAVHWKRPAREDCKWSEWRYTGMQDEDFEKWALCRKCHEPMHIPKMLPCLHTVCLRCLQIHFNVVRKQIKAQSEKGVYNFLDVPGCFTCPLCSFHCYVTGPAGVTVFPTNKRLLALSYMERVVRLREIDMIKCPQTSKKSRRTSSKMAITTEQQHLLQNGGGQSPESDRGNSGSECMAKSYFDTTSSNRVTFLPLEDALRKHDEYVRKECSSSPEEIVGELETVWPHDATLPSSLPEFGYAHPCGSFKLMWGDQPMEVTAPSAVAVNPLTGHVVVVDSMLCKALLYKKSLDKPWTYKQFARPVMDVMFYPTGFSDAARENQYDRSNPPPNKGKKELKLPARKEQGHHLPDEFGEEGEVFCAMGRIREQKGVMIYRVPFTKDPYEVLDVFQDGVRDVSGLLLLPEGRMCLALSYDNSVLLQMKVTDVSPSKEPGGEMRWQTKFMYLADRPGNGLYNPTHLILGDAGQIILSDTNNHRLGVFYGTDYFASDFYCEFGHGKGQLFYPLGLARDSNQLLYVCDAGNHRVQVLDHGFAWHGFAIRATYRMGLSVEQDVKPIDCCIDSKDRLYVLFKGRQYASLQIFKYQTPLVAVGDEEGVPQPVFEEASCDCGQCCCFCCMKCCCQHRLPNREYETIQ